MTEPLIGAAEVQPRERTDVPLPTRVQWHLVVPFAVVTLLWSTTWIVIRDQIGVVSPSWSVCYRFLAAAIGMFVWIAVKRETFRIDGAGHRLALILGVVMFAGNFNFVYRAEEHVTSGVVAVAFALLVIPNAILARIFLGQSVTTRFAIGSMIGVVGVLLLFMHELGTVATAAGNPALGIALTLVAVALASTGNILQATANAKRQSLSAFLAWGMLYGAGFNAVLGFIVAGPPQIDPRPAYIFGVLYLGLAASMLAFQCYFGLIRAIGPARAGYANVLVPVIAMTISSIFEGYRWTPTSLAGAVLAVIGLVVALRARSPA